MYLTLCTLHLQIFQCAHPHPSPDQCHQIQVLAAKTCRYGNRSVVRQFLLITWITNPTNPLQQCLLYYVSSLTLCWGRHLNSLRCSVSQHWQWCLPFSLHNMSWSVSPMAFIERHMVTLNRISDVSTLGDCSLNNYMYLYM